MGNGYGRKALDTGSDTDGLNGNGGVAEVFRIPEKEITPDGFDVLRILRSAPSRIPSKHGQNLVVKNFVASFSLVVSDATIAAVVAALFEITWQIVPIFILMSFMHKLYSKSFPFWDELGKILGVSFFSSLLSFLFSFKPSVFLFIPVASPAVFVIRFLLKDILWLFGVRERVLIVGGGLAAVRVLKAIDAEKTLGYDVIGVLDDDRTKLWKPIWRFRGRDVVIIGQTSDIWNILKETHVDEVILAIPSLGDRALTALASHLQKFVPKVSVVPDMFGLPVLIDLKYSFGHQVLFLTVQNKLANPFNRFIKELMDKLLALITFLITLPLMVIIAIAIKLDSAGPIIFSHERVGKNGRRFRCFKFRTMHVNGDELLERYFAKNPQARDVYLETGKIPDGDPRVTRVGRVLRKFSLDELPQILNVLKGDMSLVGPRALVPEEVERCSEYYMEWAKYIKPGITGLAQIMGRANISHEHKNIISIWYMKNWSLWLDVVILMKTVFKVIKAEGAY